MSDIGLAGYFEKVSGLTNNPKLSANWILGELTRELNNSGKHISESPAGAEHLAELLTILASGSINNSQAKEALIEMFATGKTAAVVIAEKGFEQVSDSSSIEKIVDEVIAANEKNVAAYRGGNEKLFGFFVGQVMKASHGKANPKVVNELLKKKL
ncbi:MAG: hypothetical protein H0X08_02510 [Blastocatellia bacterium]|nr:hypothetical protein [Blastocatellia bacterium]